MCYRNLRLAALLTAVGIALAGCGESASTDRTGGAEAPQAAIGPTAVVYSATGTLNSIDRAARTVNISHEAVPSAQWPAMTMDFHVAQAVNLQDLGVEPGQRIAFEFTTAADGTVTKIEPVP